jgi:hypothetical protein
MNEIYKRLKSKLDKGDNEGYLADMLIMINKIDLWSFGIVLLEYLSSVRELKPSEDYLKLEYEVLESNIHQFLDETNILDPNPFVNDLEDLDVEEIFKGMYENLLIQIESTKRGGFKNIKLKRKSKLNRNHKLKGGLRKRTQISSSTRMSGSIKSLPNSANSQLKKYDSSPLEYPKKPKRKITPEQIKILEKITHQYKSAIEKKLNEYKNRKKTEIELIRDKMLSKVKMNNK